ncbi:hypothetical protein ASPWEDRAFT_62647 [Aspergillus wentii DTO 134E9]|uniref:Uncharacterized protein n=1 Tax=Aspergillus wentii DTO 134E9 TaxID=1073089 RepID=A0A1L9R9F5_ASPWE|nr:uncharacterized protein ASPWEDRAFT_62647 [Aspergillus wentii DTO 134E9]OJJ31513.1 hypothetical protein ASPWEDRAFT_62647 [Aspergillus wentii DTO 134E9]
MEQSSGYSSGAYNSESQQLIESGNAADLLHKSQPASTHLNLSEQFSTQIQSSQSQPQKLQQIQPDPSLSSIQNNDLSVSEPHCPPNMAMPGQKRTAASGIKSPSNMVGSQSPEVNGTGRHRSKSIGSDPHGSRIAALSVHLRTRLSYAAAKIEKDWRQNETSGLLPNVSRALSVSAVHGSSQRSPFHIEPVKGHPFLDAGSPEGTTVSAPDPSASSHFYNPNDFARVSPLASSDIMPSYSAQRTSQFYPTKLHQPPRLAPPADIISNAGSGRRRHPNPNEMPAPSYYNPSSYRRHRSQHDLDLFKPNTSPPKVLVPGTPPPVYPFSTPYGGLSKPRTDSQNALMEQDAIETLLHLSSSPGHSGHHPSPRRQQNIIPNSVNGSIGTRSNGTGCQHRSSQTSSSYEHAISEYNRVQGLEAQAGDDIDRMLDQMEDSDSENENYPSNRYSHFRTGSALATNSRGYSAPSECPKPWYTTSKS